MSPSFSLTILSCADEILYKLLAFFASIIQESKYMVVYGLGMMLCNIWGNIFSAEENSARATRSNNCALASSIRQN